MNTPDHPAELIYRASEYLLSGGLFNPELMDHGKVRDLIVDMRDHLALPAQPVTITDELVERACLAYIASARHHYDGDIPDTTYMRAALTAAFGVAP